MANKQKLPIENVGQERAVLGCLIGDIDLYWTVRDRVTPDLFSTIVHKAICETMHRIADGKITGAQRFSIPAIVTRLPEMDLDDFDADSYVAMLTASDADPEDFGDHLEDLEAMAARRRIIEIAQTAIATARDDDGLSAMEKVADLARLFDGIGNTLSPPTKTIGQIATRVVMDTQDAFEAGARVGLEYGLASLQGLMGPLLPDTLYMLAGPAGSGKTALAEQIARDVAEWSPVLLESLEMPDKHIARRHLSRQTGIRARDITRAAVSWDQLVNLAESAKAMEGLALYVDSSRDMTVARIRAKALRMKQKHGLSLLIIDHLQYLKKADPKLDDVAAVRPNLKALKHLAKDLGIPVVILAQLNANFESGPWSLRLPQNGDLYGGSGIVQEVDVLVFVHRLEYTLKQKEPDKGNEKDHAAWQAAYNACRGQVKFIMTKNRDDEGVNRATAYFEKNRTTFHDNRPDDDDSPVPLLDRVVPKDHVF